MKNLRQKSKQQLSSSFDNLVPGQIDSNQDHSPYYDDIHANNSNQCQLPVNIAEQPKSSTQPKQSHKLSTNTEPSMLQFKLQKLLEESQKREENYQAYIKQKHQESYEMTENYIKTLKQYKEQLDRYIEDRHKKKQEKYKYYQSNKVFRGQASQFSIFDKQKLLPFTSDLYNHQNPSHRVDLKCTITFKSFTPFIKDYLKQKFPTNLNIQIRLPIKPKYVVGCQKATNLFEVSVVIDEDENQNIQNLMHGYPFSLTPCANRNGREATLRQGQNIKLVFTVLNQRQNLQYLEKSRVWINLLNRDSQMLYGYSSFPARHLLQYHKESSISQPITTQQTQIIDFYSPYNHNKNCSLQFKLEIQPLYALENTNRVQSNQPMQLARIQADKNLYGDIESRMIQRINKFKTSTQSLLMQPDPHYFDKQPDKEQYFKNTNDKTLIEHRKKKELQTINKFKEERKSQYIQKLFDEALQKFSSQEITLGIPKFLAFYFEKQKAQYQRFYLKTSLKIVGHIPNEDEILNQIELKLVDSEVVRLLKEQEVLRLKQNARTEFGIVNSEQSVHVIEAYDENIAIILKLIVFPTLKMEDIVLGEENNFAVEVCLKIQSETSQLLSQQIFKLRPIKYDSQYELNFHNYECEQEEISIPLNFQSLQFKTQSDSIQVIASADVEYKVSKDLDRLDLKVKYPKITQSIGHIKSKQTREIQITLLDQQMNLVFAAYKLNLFSYHKMKELPNYSIGQICKYCFQLQIDQQVNLNRSKLQNNHIANSKTALVGFYTSHPNECTVFCGGRNQLMIQSNRKYKIEAIFQSFCMDTDQDRVVIHMIDVNLGSVLKKWLLKISKEFEDFRSVLQVKVQRSQVVKYKYLLKNRSSKQKSFKFFSSNYSIMLTPQSAIKVAENQEIYVELEIAVRKQELSAQEKQKGIPVILRVQDEQTSDAWNQLFRVQLS